MSQVLTAPPGECKVEHSIEARQRYEQAEAGVWRRRLTVALRIEAEAGDDSPLAGLVDEALREYLEGPCGRGEGDTSASGMFESRAGLDVHWRAINRYYQGDKLIGERGVNDRGERVDSMLDGLVKPDGQTFPVPCAMATIDADGNLLIEGVRYSPAFFKVMANPDPAKRYAITRQGDVVNVVERP